MKNTITEEILVNRFKTDFALYFGYYPSVSLENKIPAYMTMYTLRTLANEVDRFGDPSEKIRGTSRKRKAAILRTIYCMVAADHNFTYKEIGNTINRHYSTVIYNVNTGYDQLENDREFRDMYMTVSKSINPKLYPHARITPIINDVPSNTKSTGAPRLYTPKYEITRPDPRQKGKFTTLKKHFSNIR